MNRPTGDVQAFEAHATDADLDDLRARLAAARLPEAETVYRAAQIPGTVYSIGVDQIGRSLLRPTGLG